MRWGSISSRPCKVDLDMLLSVEMWAVNQSNTPPPDITTGDPSSTSRPLFDFLWTLHIYHYRILAYVVIYFACHFTHCELELS
jgi:hypothetical protein